MRVSKKHKRYIPPEQLERKKTKMFCFETFPEEFQQYENFFFKKVSFMMLKIESLQTRNKLAALAEKLPF